MSWRWWAEFLLVYFIAGVIGWNLYLLIQRPRLAINADRAHRVRVGMSQEEVHAVFRLPPGDHTRLRYGHWPGNSLKQLALAAHGPEWTPTTTCEQWLSDEVRVSVQFESGKVVHVECKSMDEHPRRPWREIIPRLLPGGW